MLENGEFDVPLGKMAVVVTYLEMTSRAPVRHVDLPDGLTFRQITPDLDTYRDIFGRVGGADWLWYGRLAMDDQTLSDIIEHPDVHIFTLTKDGRDEALLELDFRTKDECELAYFGLTAPLIGSGAGRFLMNSAITRAWDAGISRFHVHTCTHDSPQALSFYIRSGFTPHKRTVDIDDDPRLTGLLPHSAGPAFPII